MKILLFGKDGQVGWELQRALSPLGELVSLDRAGELNLVGDLSNLEGIRETIRLVKPDVVVNAAAYTAVDKAESEVDLAQRINCDAPAVMAEEALTLDAMLVHYSTDYVFNGSGESPWVESDQPEPINEYGTTKLAGEKAIQANGCKHLIFRTSWVFAARAKNFLITMESLIKQRDSLTIVADQIGAPTSAELIADVTAHAIRKMMADTGFSGLYHLAAAGETSWQGYAQYISQWLSEQGVEIKAGVTQIGPVATADYPTDAARPLNSRLNTQLLESRFGIYLPSWQDGVARSLAERNL